MIIVLYIFNTNKNSVKGDTINLGGFYGYKLGNPIKQVLILE